MHENKFNNYRIPAGLLITFLEKALNLIHMETHLNDVRDYQPIIAQLERGNESLPATFYVAQSPLL